MLSPPVTDCDRWNPENDPCTCACVDNEQVRVRVLVHMRITALMTNERLGKHTLTKTSIYSKHRWGCDTHVVFAQER